jgi:hypothetical protein
MAGERRARHGHGMLRAYRPLAGSATPEYSKDPHCSQRSSLAAQLAQHTHKKIDEVYSRFTFKLTKPIAVFG